MQQAELALTTTLITALEQMPRETVEAIVRRVFEEHPAPDVLPHEANILFYANPANPGVLYMGFRARYSFKCIAGEYHEATADNLWVGSSENSEIRDIDCGCGVTQVKFVRPK